VLADTVNINHINMKQIPHVVLSTADSRMDTGKAPVSIRYQYDSTDTEVPQINNL